MPRPASRLMVVGAVYKAVQKAMRPGGPSLGDRASALPRMARAVAAGDYVGVSKGRLALMAAAAGYIASPIDLIPEAFAPVLGLADDAVVLGWLATQIVEETEAFLEWERSVGRASPGPTSSSGTSSAGSSGGPAAGPGSRGTSGTSGTAGRPASRQTVRGDVVDD
ncbi:YkvA family protein [Oryzobacter terrae]|uniref:YkvA family protein n=1 Tax=Oryzobacter terrae TaxID=1620385 RepID=UPI00366AF8B9